MPVISKLNTWVFLFIFGSAPNLKRRSSALSAGKRIHRDLGMVTHMSQSLKLWLKSFDPRSKGRSGQEGIRLLITSRHLWLTRLDQIEAPKSRLPYLCHHWADLSAQEWSPGIVWNKISTCHLSASTLVTDLAENWSTGRFVMSQW